MTDLGPPPSQWSTTCLDETEVLMPCFLFLFQLFFYVKHHLPKNLTITQNDHWYKIEDKELLVWPNQQEYPKCDINSLVTRTSRSRINHTLDWMVTVLLWCRNMKPVYFKDGSNSLTSVNKLWRKNWPFVAWLLTLFDMILLKYELVWMWIILIWNVKK